MRYVLLKSRVSLEEIRSRQEYLYDVFKIYVIPLYHENYIELKSIPENYGDVIFINEHNGQVYNFLLNEALKEHNIVMITCYKGLVKKIKFPDKDMFFTNTTTDRLNGQEYSFAFEITDSELNLYNCPYNRVKDKIKYSFERVN